MNREKLSPEKVALKLGELRTWVLDEEKKVISKRFTFENFSAALAFVNKAGEFADEMNHHPDIKLGWGYAEFEITTHDRGGLTEFDFALAEKIEEINQ
ncbi:MAG: 4a-hydroxytetrahydrobiopterin dehydratase [Pyrinomonadaceae bacterium]